MRAVRRVFDPYLALRWWIGVATIVVLTLWFWQTALVVELWPTAKPEVLSSHRTRAVTWTYVLFVAVTGSFVPRPKRSGGKTPAQQMLAFGVLVLIVVAAFLFSQSIPGSLADRGLAVADVVVIPPGIVACLRRWSREADEARREATLATA